MLNNVWLKNLTKKYTKTLKGPLLELHSDKNVSAGVGLYNKKKKLTEIKTTNGQ